MTPAGVGERVAMLGAIELRVGAIGPRVREALLDVDRAAFVRPQDVSLAWIDEPLPLDTPYGDRVATISAPHAYVLGFEALELAPGDALLELGSGSGYGAACSTELHAP